MSDDLGQELDRELQRFREEVGAIDDADTLYELQVRYIGKKGTISRLRSGMGKLAPDQRKAFGQSFNATKQAIEDAIAQRKGAIAAQARSAELSRLVDLTLLPGEAPVGSLHPITRTRRHLEEVFRGMGFEIEDGPHVEDEQYNFDDLNMPADHPARDMQDTFFVRGKGARDVPSSLVLRTHTSPVQVRTMLQRKPPIRVVALGTVFRRDDDATHSPMFHQIEGLRVDKGVSMADLKATLYRFVGSFFGARLEVRLRPSFFPFVEPGAEFDIQCPFGADSSCSVCKGSGWIELGGAGMVHPNVFTACGIDPEAYTGWAFGFGIDRMAMLLHGVPDLRLLFEGDVRFLEQFPVLISRTLVESMLTPAEGTPLTDEQFGDVITTLGLEVEGVTAYGVGLETIVVGRVEEVAPHPKADKLRLVQLFDGTQTVPVVCGAPNVPDPGGRIAFAPVGTRLPGGLEIGAREIRGVGSQGMICSEVELEIGTDHEGIMVLPGDWEPGARLVDLVPGIVDTVYELGITPNRPDALGHVGVAADLAVKLQRTFTLSPPTLPAAVAMPELVTLDAPQRCGRYIGRAYEGASIGPSPLWLRVRLHRLGLRPINNVVDITNFVLVEWGQPLHAFDRDKLAQGRVVIRRARADEPMTTLDEQELQLTSDDLVIADASKPQALAGVMGGLHSGVEDGATNLLLEAAWFDPTSIRRTARTHGQGTDSSYRFERGVDFGAHLSAAAGRAGALIEELTGARCVAAHEATGQLPVIPTIPLRLARSSMLLGMEVAAQEARRILTGLEVSVDDTDPQCWECRPPSHRPDLQREVDLVEELMRHHGLELLPNTPSLPSAISLETTPDQTAHDKSRQRDAGLLRALSEEGLHEHISLVFSSAEALEAFAGDTPLARAVAVANPMRAAANLMRTHMMPGLLDAMAVNVARHAREIRLFEYGRIYEWPAQPRSVTGPTAAVDARLPLERQRAAIVLSDGARPEAARIDGRTLAGILVRVLARIGVHGHVRPCETQDRASWLHPGVQAHLAVARPSQAQSGADRVTPWVTVGRFGQLHPELADRWEIADGAPVFYGELWVEALPAEHEAQYEAVPRFPATSRDLSLEIPAPLPAAWVVEALRTAEAEATDGSVSDAADDPARLAPGDRGQGAVEVLEEYRGEGIAEDHRALLLRLHYRAKKRSVTDAEVQELHETIVRSACDALRPRAPSIRTR